MMKIFLIWSADTYFVSVTDDNSVTENSPPIVITQPSAFTVNYEIIPGLCGGVS